MRVVIEKLNKKFKNHQVLKDVSLEVNDHEVVVVMGESGCGKTTLLRCLCDLEQPDAGKISLDDWVVYGGQSKLSRQERQRYHRLIGMVLQNYQLFPHRTVLENCCEAPVYQKLMNKQEAMVKARELLSQLNLLDQADQYPHTLSGGQKQRVAIARACMLQPEVLCFDEPTSALDANTIEQLYPLIDSLKEKMAVVIITHDEAFAKKVGTRVVRMHDINPLDEK